ncbi:BamA/OMP85 family outer membrane protein [Lignipirellula cremea]|uniref:Outer membrane protein assembly factor BamA n=1 Tax=Lignipirellula cremea TaxID=2528010 RepID=A0A518DT28_9BACT|nr:POTRA domain-containing protein [Lignipirellula cremea]QDU94990.1 Outer membrane protein assembly factor BamA precursor [Lignipirellula cremea]
MATIYRKILPLACAWTIVLGAPALPNALAQYGPAAAQPAYPPAGSPPGQPARYGLPAPPPGAYPAPYGPGAAPGYQQPAPGYQQPAALPQPGPLPAPAKVEASTGMLIRGVLIRGNQQTTKARIRSVIKSRPGREFDTEILQSDVRAISRMRLFNDVRTYTEVEQGEVIVTFEVVERKVLERIEFIGNRQMTERNLLKESGLKKGDPLDLGAVNEGQQKLLNFYRTKGFPQAEVVIVEGNKPGDQAAVYNISEGPLQRIRWTHFEGNVVASDSRLKTLIASKPGWAWYFFGGRVDETVITSDESKLTAYYRNLGYFKARVGRELLPVGDDGAWVDVVFVIDEGPRYKIRNVTLVGNRKFRSETLQNHLELQSGQEFNMEKMQKDVNQLRDIYGAQGHVYCNVTPDPRFLEEPGQLDLVYSIEEGAQYRVGRVNVHIAGEYPHTRENVIRNRISLQPGDIIDSRQIKESERRLRSAELFRVDAAHGVSPYIKVEPLDEKRAAEALAREQGTTVRGQSPDEDIRYVDLNVHTPPLRDDAADADEIRRLPPIEDESR